jgi:hypothetical protein
VIVAPHFDHFVQLENSRPTRWAARARRLAVLIPGLLLFPLALAQDPQGCDDLSAIAQTPRLVFERDIQPLLENAGCTGCHGGAGGLSLGPDQALSDLVGVTSSVVPDRLRVDPGNPLESMLFLAINCEQPGGSLFRMPSQRDDPEFQALIRDWIAQGARGDSIQQDRFQQP